MKKPCIHAFLSIALCCAGSRGYSQTDPNTWAYVVDGNHDRASVAVTTPNVLGVLPVGANYLRIIAPDVLELVRITDGRLNNPDRSTWDFSQALPGATEFEVDVNGTAVSGDAQQVGLKRRGLYGPIEQNDARIENTLY